MEEDWGEITPLFQDEDFMAFSPNGVWVATSAIACFWEIQKHDQQYGYAKNGNSLKRKQLNYWIL